MTNIFVDCPHCNQKIGIEKSDLGKEIVCPVCQNSFIINNNTKKDKTSIAQPTDTPSQQAIKSFTDNNTKKNDISISSPTDTPSKQTKFINQKSTLKQLKCEMCGSTDFVQQDGAYICRFCKTRYIVVQEQDKTTEGDNGIPVSKIDEKERLENLYALAEQALDQQKYEEALSYYRVILVEQKDYWKPVFYTCYLNHLCTEITFDNMAGELDVLGKGFIKAVKLFVETEDFREHSNIIRDLIDKIYKICNEHEQNNNDWIKKHYKESNALEYLNGNKNSISALYTLFGNYSNKYLNDTKKALLYWKKACELTQDKELKKIIVEKIHKYEPEYEPPSVVFLGLTKGCLIFVGIVFGIIISIVLLGERGYWVIIALMLFFLVVCLPSLSRH